MDDFVLPIGKARIGGQGTDVTIVSFGIGMLPQGGRRCAGRQRASAELIDLRTLRPMDTATVMQSVQKTNRCVTVERAGPSPRSAPISRPCDDAGLRLSRCAGPHVTGKDVPMPYAANLEKLALGTVDDVIAAVRAVCYR
jgi:pyruvate dehydrogenase E1 component beta subunit